VAGRQEDAVQQSPRFRLALSPATAVLILVAVVGIYLLVSAGSRALQTYRMAGQEQRVRGEIAELQRHHRELVALREYLRSDEYIEGVARRVLGLVRPGEKLVIVSGPEPPPEGGASSGEAADGGAEESLGRPGQPWWEALFGP